MIYIMFTPDLIGDIHHVYSGSHWLYTSCLLLIPLVIYIMFTPDLIGDTHHVDFVSYFFYPETVLTQKHKDKPSTYFLSTFAKAMLKREYVSFLKKTWEDYEKLPECDRPAIEDRMFMIYLSCGIVCWSSFYILLIIRGGHKIRYHVCG